MEVAKVNLQRQGIIFRHNQYVYELYRTNYSQISIKKLNTTDDKWDKIGNFKPIQPQFVRKKSSTLILPLLFKPIKSNQMTTITLNPLRLYMYHKYPCTSCYKFFLHHTHQCLSCLSINIQTKEYEIERLDLDLEDLLKKHNICVNIKSTSNATYGYKSYRIIGLTTLNNKCHLLVNINESNKEEYVLHIYHDADTKKFEFVTTILNYNGEPLFMYNKNNVYHHIERNVTSLKMHKYKNINSSINETISIDGAPKWWTRFECCVMIKGNYCILIESNYFYLLNTTTLTLNTINSAQIPIFDFNMQINDIIYDAVEAILITKGQIVDEILMAGFIRILMNKAKISMYRYPPQYLIRLMTMYYCHEIMYLMRRNIAKTHFYIWKFNIDHLFCSKKG